jgi:hypothetical protein
MGYAFGSIDELGEGYGFRKVRHALGVTAFGVNAIVYPPGCWRWPAPQSRRSTTRVAPSKPVLRGSEAVRRTSSFAVARRSASLAVIG